jgi:hypothetical protein
MADLPSGPALLALARSLLPNELMRMLPEDRRQDARLVARCMATAQVEAETGETLDHELRTLYGIDPDELLHRFACELRLGVFENSPEREVHARAILWRLTVARLSRSNPEFLAANGFASRAAWSGEQSRVPVPCPASGRRLRPG